MKFPGSKSFLLLFALIFILNLLALDVIPDYRLVLKPMIVVSLIGYYIVKSRRQANGFILALIFALMGDIFLAFTGVDFFLLGLGSFLIMQVLYGITFLKYKSGTLKSVMIKTLPVIVLATVILGALWSGLGDMKLPVTLYTSAITFMVCTALVADIRLEFYYYLVAGVLLFLVSDAAIGFAKFAKPFAGIDYLIISTYMLAQYLIVTSVADPGVKTTTH